MNHNKSTTDVLPTTWRVSDDLWQRIEPILLELDPPAARGSGGCPRCDGLAPAQWTAVESAAEGVSRRLCLPGRLLGTSHPAVVDPKGCLYCDLGGAHRSVRRVGRGLLRVAGGRYSHGKARLGGDAVGPPTDRGKAGVKRALLVEEQDGPLSVVIDGAKRHDTKLLDAPIEAIDVARALPGGREEYLCLGTRPTTIQRVTVPLRPMAIRGTSAGSARSGSTIRVRRRIRRVAG